MHTMARVIAVFLLAVAAIPISSPAAQAGVLDASCIPPSSSVVTYNPPLTKETKTVAFTSSRQYGPCGSVSQPALTSATSGGASTLTTSCAVLLHPGTAVFSLTWNTGQTSTLSGNRVANTVGVTTTVTTTGTVTAGLFQGDTFVHQAEGPATDILLCELGLGTVSSIYSILTLTITSV